MSAAWACGMLRAWASSIAIVCSAVVRMFDCGAFTTITPWVVAASVSTLSSPMPARPTTTRSCPAASTSAVTVVAERMIRAWAPAHGLEQLLGVRSSWRSTSWPAAAEAVEAAVGDLLGDQDAGHGRRVWSAADETRQPVEQPDHRERAPRRAPARVATLRPRPHTEAP